MIDKLRRFLVDSAGAYAPLFAIVSLPVLGSVSAAVEYSNIYRTYNAIQVALDASALAAAKELAFTDDEAYLKAFGRDFFEANLADHVPAQEIAYSLTFTQGEVGGGRIDVSAQHVYDTYMAGVIGIREVPMSVTASIATGNRTIEVAIVVDNSGSMDTESGDTGQTRMELARAAAAELVTQLGTVASLSNKADPVKIALVPFASSVNLGASYRGADWLDMRGWSSVHHLNIDWAGTGTNGDPWPDAVQSGVGWKSATTTTLNAGPNPPDPLPPGITNHGTTWLSRWTLYDALGVEWAGCVEMRPNPYHGTDEAPNDLTPDTLFVPMFAPDEPDRYNTNEDRDYANKYLGDYIRVGTDHPAATINYGSNSKQLLRQSWARKYNLDARLKDGSNNIVIGTERSRDFGPYGPNQGCTTKPVTPLSGTLADIQTAITQMSAGGYTNIQEGLAWGWRLLSAGQPFTQGRSYSVAENDKYIILLTDGNNTYPSQSTLNKTEYYPWGYGRHNRLYGGLASWTSDVDAMNQQTARTCANIKAVQDADQEEAVRIFTIVYDVADGSSVKSLLQECASVGKRGERFYYDVQGAGIAEAMASIGAVISELRIAR